MLTKSTSKLIRSLKQKKYRDKSNLFVVEGDKSIVEFLQQGFQPIYLFSTEEKKLNHHKTTVISPKELQSFSNLTNPQKTLAVFEKRKPSIPSNLNAFYYALDGVRDPGNFGTIIRLADWYGIQDIFCSLDCVDAYNPKVVQATMGSLSRVKVHSLELFTFMQSFGGDIFGSFMDGENIYKMDLKPKGILVLGNEGKGISPEIEKLCKQRVSIPQFGKDHTTESLNVAIAGAIITSTFFSKI